MAAGVGLRPAEVSVRESDPGVLSDLRRAQATKYGLQQKVLDEVEAVRKVAGRSGDDGRVAVRLSIPDAG